RLLLRRHVASDADVAEEAALRVELGLAAHAHVEALARGRDVRVHDGVVERPPRLDERAQRALVVGRALDPEIGLPRTPADEARERRGAAGDVASLETREAELGVPFPEPVGRELREAAELRRARVLRQVAGFRDEALASE